MMKLITPIPGTDKRVKTVEYEEGRFCIDLQQNAENLMCYPWEVQEDGWRSSVSITCSSQIEAYDLHDQFIGREVRMEYECKQ